MKSTQIVLNKGPGYSGRGVRYQQLSPTQVDQIREESAKELPDDDDLSKEAKQQIWINAQKRAAVSAMVRAVTQETGLKSQDEALKATWTKPNVDELTSTPQKYFTTKDLDALGDIFFRLHLAQKEEVDNILGEALDVTAD